MSSLLSKTWIGVAAGVIAAGAVIFFAKDSVLGNPGISVVYEVTGHGIVNLEYAVDGTQATEQATLPWRKTVTMTKRVFPVHVKATGIKGSGIPATCKVRVDGESFVDNEVPKSNNGWNLDVMPALSCTAPYKKN